MTPFAWVDRAGARHELTECAPIEAEYRAVARELLALRPRLEDRGDQVYLEARQLADPLRRRLVRLQDDLRAWDKACADEVRAEAAKANGVIASIAAEARHMRQLHICYEQYGGAWREGRARLDGPPTPEQLAILKEQALREKREFTAPATLIRAQATLGTIPATNRVPLTSDVRAFEWRDRNDHRHQIRSLIPIEAEYIQIAGELEQLLPGLSPETPVRECAVNLERADVAVKRISILEREMRNWTAFVIALDREDYRRTLDALESLDDRDQ